MVFVKASFKLRMKKTAAAITGIVEWQALHLSGILLNPAAC
jgi:hypothetical protein